MLDLLKNIALDVGSAIAAGIVMTLMAVTIILIAAVPVIAVLILMALLGV